MSDLLIFAGYLVVIAIFVLFVAVVGVAAYTSVTRRRDDDQSR